MVEEENKTRDELLEELRDSEMRFRSVTQSAVDAIVSADTHDRIIFWNKAAEKMFGYTEEEILGKPVIVLMPESYRRAHREGVKRHVRTGRQVLIGNTKEVQALRKNGQEFPIELSLAKWTAKGKSYFTAIIRDITQRKEAEHALEQQTEEARRRKEELETLVQMVAHDLKSPVLTIAGLVRVLKKRLSGAPWDERRDRILHQLGDSSETLESFLKELLDGLEADATEPRPEPVGIHEAVNYVLARHKEHIEENGINVEVDIPESIPRVYADRNRIRQVLDNLVTNSIRYMGERSDPKIRIQARQEDRSIVTGVSDNGIGIPVEFQGRIFDRFFRAPDTGVKLGSGLGLSIVKDIIETHGGRVWLDSEEGKGTTITFTLPQFEKG